MLVKYIMIELHDILNIIGKFSAYVGGFWAFVLAIMVLYIIYQRIKLNNEYDYTERVTVTQSNCQINDANLYDCGVIYTHKHNGERIDMGQQITNAIAPIKQHDQMIALSSDNGHHYVITDVDRIMLNDWMIAMIIFVIALLMLRIYLVNRYESFSQFTGLTSLIYWLH